MKRFNDLERGMVNILVPPNLHAGLTGVTRCQQDKSGAITLLYSDGTRETRPCKLDMLSEFSGLLGVIDYVQAGR